MSEPATAQYRSVRLSDVTTRDAEPDFKLKLTTGAEGKALKLELHGDPSKGDAAGELERMLGAGAEGFLEGLVQQIGWGCRRGDKVDLEAANFVLSVVVGARPRDQMEAMLAVQMGLVQLHIARQSNALMTAGLIMQHESARNGLTKLCRAYTGQLDALKRYRTGGEQKVTVEHVTVNAGGRAIVGPVSTGEGGFRKPEPTS